MSTDVVSVPVSGPSSDPSLDTDAVDSTTPMPAASNVTANGKDQTEGAKPAAAIFLHSPPDSSNATKSEGSDSELSELEDEPTLDDAPATDLPAPELAPTVLDGDEDIGEVVPDEWSGAVPIFRPTWHQFKDFQKFMKQVDRYGMKSGVIKIIPPKEWKDAQPPLDDLVKTIRVREPIKQDIMGSNGTYRQVNILHGRSYNVPQWRQLCEQSEHQPPARRGERRANADKPRPTRSRPAAPKPASIAIPKKRGRGRPAKNKGKKTTTEAEERPMTPVSPKPEFEEGAAKERAVESIEKYQDQEKQVEDFNHRDDDDDDDKPDIGRMGRRMPSLKVSKPKTQSVSARRKYSRREGSATVDEEAFKNFDYQMDISDFTTERCEELERAYWKTLTYAAPLYGADMMGTLFDDRTETWNLNKLPNLLDVLGTKIPGVNTAYLYLGMWKATFAWHLEDVDLYSINYLHFGAPKQWYSISQADARRFEAAMRSVWPADAKACSQFLRHKGFLISPHHLWQQYGIKVNKVVSYPGEFVVTYPYGYHSGYNLGYNCAEAVNFALDTWLEMGKIAKRCECAQAQDSVWINVHEIERKLRGEETEYEETDEDDEDEDEEELSGLPTPPASYRVKFKDAVKKRKRGPGEQGPRVKKVKKIRLRLKTKAEPTCCLCPHDIAYYETLSTDDGRKAHKICALYLPETYIDSVNGKDVICNVGGVHKDRLMLKCLFCRSRRGACFQCSHKKCARGYHATCAAAAGVFVEDQEVPIFDENGIEYKEQAFEFSCRFHRTRRDKRIELEALEADDHIKTAAKQLQRGDTCQMQFLKGEIFAGVVVENREHEEAVLLDILPHGDRLEVEWKWLILPHPSDYHLPKASSKALPMPASRGAKVELKAKRLRDEPPRKDDEFAQGYTWAEFELYTPLNKDQRKVDFNKAEQIWHYLGRTSTEARAQYTEDVAQQRHNPRGNFLDTLPKPPKPAPVSRQSYHHQSYVAKAMAYSYNLAANHAAANMADKHVSIEKPYVYKPKKPAQVISSAVLIKNFAQSLPPAATAANNVPTFHGYQHRSSNLYKLSGMHGQPTGGGLNCDLHISTSQADHQRPPQTALQASGQQCKPSWQVYSSVYQKYPFFQVNHNRESLKYRTPYAPCGGFTNGYEGDLRAYLMANKQSIVQQPEVNIATQQHEQQQQQQQQQHQQRHVQHHIPPQVSSPHATKTKPPLASKTFKVPAKVSPVPLPLHVVAAMAKTAQHSPNNGTGWSVRTPPKPPTSKLPHSQPCARTFLSEQSQSSLSAPTSPAAKSTGAADCTTSIHATQAMPSEVALQPLQEFADVPGSESMQFMDRMMQNLRRASMNGSSDSSMH